jgi:hypothetical protein
MHGLLVVIEDLGVAAEKGDKLSARGTERDLRNMLSQLESSKSMRDK